MTDQLIGTRIRALRKKRGLSQEKMARMFGFKDRQTVSAIETGVRRVTASELLLAVEKLNAPLDYFSDPFRLDGEGRFSWRQTNVGQLELREYEEKVSRWIGAYRTLTVQLGRQAQLTRQSLRLTKSSSFDDAIKAGERFVEEFELGSVPAQRLATVIQERLGILVLMVDVCPRISGAACRLPEFDVVLIAREEVVGRRNFDLAHELFHILTWDAMPPKHVENASDYGGGRVEQLANNFAAGVLMPKVALKPFVNWSKLGSDDLIAQLNVTADKLEVASSTLRWRLVALRQLTKSKARSIPEGALRNNGRKINTALPPPLFSRSFVDVISKAINRGYLSVRRASALVDLSIEDLDELFLVHRVDHAIEL